MNTPNYIRGIADQIAPRSRALVVAAEELRNYADLLEQRKPLTPWKTAELLVKFSQSMHMDQADVAAGIAFCAGIAAAERAHGISSPKALRITGIGDKDSDVKEPNIGEAMKP